MKCPVDPKQKAIMLIVMIIADLVSVTAVVTAFYVCTRVEPWGLRATFFVAGTILSICSVGFIWLNYKDYKNYYKK